MKRKIFSVSLLLSLMAPLAALAQGNGTAQVGGISDSILLTLMIGFVLLLLVIIQALSSAIKSISKSEKLAENLNTNQAAKAIITLFLLGTSFGANAANEAASETVFVMGNTLFWILTALIITLAVVVFVLFKALSTLIKLQESKEVAEEETAEKTADIFEALSLTDNVPLEEEESVMLDHDYDGIKELDNNLPPWWVYMFYATIIFAVVYIVRFHITGNGQLSHEEYMAEMNEAAVEKAEMMANATESITEDNVVFLVDAPTIDKGAAIYQGNCATCHGQLGEGGAGPNLTDEYWIHGGSMKSIFKTIKYGVPEKGMIAWQSQFSPKQMQQVASYIKTLKGTNPPNGKAPQGEVFVEEIPAEESDSLATEENDTMKVVVEMDK
ncbi:MAG: cbb3-type cytochrome c oxidase N-terminal domain-containing protein [Vicingaceae bacterium]